MKEIERMNRQKSTMKYHELEEKRKYIQIHIFYWKIKIKSSKSALCDNTENNYVKHKFKFISTFSYISICYMLRQFDHYTAFSCVRHYLWNVPTWGTWPQHNLHLSYCKQLIKREVFHKTKHMLYVTIICLLHSILLC